MITCVGWNWNMTCQRIPTWHKEVLLNDLVHPSPAKPIWSSAHHPFTALLVPLNLPSSSFKNEQHTTYVHSYFSGDQKSGRSPPFCSCQNAICRLKDVSWNSGNELEKLIWHANIALIQWFQILKIDCG